MVRSKAVPLLYANIDTDQIIPSRYLTSRTPAEFAQALFGLQRADDESFVLNRPEMAGRSVLLAGRNFGCGSSREAAVWALQAGGFRVVIAPSFGEIFQSNAFKNGLLPVQLPTDIHGRLAQALEADPGLDLTVDLAAESVTAPGAGLEVGFSVDPFYRELLLRGMRELDYLLSISQEILAYEAGPSMNANAAARIARTTQPEA